MISSLLDYYKAIETTSGQMLTAARMNDWDQVMRLEGACAVLIEQLRARAQQAELSPDERAVKGRLMLAILRHDAEIRELVDSCLDGVAHSLVTAPSRHLH